MASDERQEIELPVRPRRSRSIAIIALALVLAVVGGAWFWFGGQLAGMTNATVATPPPPPKVTVAKPVVKEFVEWDDFTGRFEATDDVAVRSRVTGYLDTVHFKDGAVIAKNDRLFTIDPRPFEAALAGSQSRVESAEATLNLADQELKRAEELRKTGTAPQTTIDQRRQQFFAATAELRGAEAAVQQARLDLEYTVIKSPITGRIGRKLISAGNLVNANDTLLTTIVALDPIHFYFDIDEHSYIAYSRLGLEGAHPSNGGSAPKLKMMIPGDPNPGREGRMDFVDNRVDGATGTMRGRALFDNSDFFLQPGMFGRVSIPGSDLYKGVLIPDEAVGSDQDRRIVYVLGADNKAVMTPIRPGPKIDGYRVVREGLKGDETIVIGGLMRVRPGAVVVPELVTLPPATEPPTP
jgi:multidrug efflux system membrane fusion protein